MALSPHPSPLYTYPDSQVPSLPSSAHKWTEGCQVHVEPWPGLPALAGTKRTMPGAETKADELTRLSCSVTSLISGFRRCKRTTIFSLQFTGPQGGPGECAVGQGMTGCMRFGKGKAEPQPGSSGTPVSSQHLLPSTFVVFVPLLLLILLFLL